VAVGADAGRMRGGLDGALADRFNGPPYLRLKST